VKTEFDLTATSVPRLTQSEIEHKLTQIITTGAPQVALSPVSNVRGAGFDRIMQIWLENSVRTRNLSLYASQT
jgi:acid phosphatase